MKTVVITGSTRGIGLCMAKVFLQNGCNVVVSGSRKETLDAAKQSLADFAQNTLFVQCDVRKEPDLQSLFDAAKQQFGRVDIWINNAGINQPSQNITDLRPSRMADIIDTNLYGMMLASKIAAQGMIQQGGGQIFNMEGLGSNNMTVPKSILYGTTKRALTYFSMGMAKEMKGSSVFIGRLSPGMMLTDFLTQKIDDEEQSVTQNPSFIKVLNILGDLPTTVADFLVPRMLNNHKNNAHIVWLTHRKIFWRFMTAAWRKNRLISDT